MSKLSDPYLSTFAPPSIDPMDVDISNKTMRTQLLKTLRHNSRSTPYDARDADADELVKTIEHIREDTQTMANNC